MIKARLNRPGDRPLLLLGLEGENMARLMADEPILIRHAQLEQIVGDDAEINFDLVIVGGKDAAAIEESLKPFMGPDTVVHRQ